MIVDLGLGPLTEPVTGKHWDRETVRERYHQRLGFFLRHGLAASDRVFLHFGNPPEFFVDLMAIWSLGGCAVPIDPRLTTFEVETLAASGDPTFSLFRERLRPIRHARAPASACACSTMWKRPVGRALGSRARRAANWIELDTTR